MPKEFDDILEGIKKSLSGKTNPRTKKTYSEDEFYAIATEAYKKKYGKTPDGKSEELFFVTDKLEYKAENENYYVCGYASTTGLDSVNDYVTPDCIEDMAQQLVGKQVKVKLGIEHDWVRTGDPRMLPHAVVEEASVVSDSGGKKLYVKTKINKHHPEFNAVWNSIKDGFYDAFSIEYLPTVKWTTNATNGESVRVLDKINLSGITFTGRPINSAARITDVFVKAHAAMDAEQVMDQILHSEGVPIQAPLQEAKNTPVEVNTKEVDSMTDVEQKAQAPSAEVELKAKTAEAEKLLAELKAQKEELEKFKTEIKAIIKDSLKTPVEEKAFEKANTETKSTLDKKLEEEKFASHMESKSSDFSIGGMFEKAFGKTKF